MSVRFVFKEECHIILLKFIHFVWFFVSQEDGYYVGIWANRSVDFYYFWKEMYIAH